MSKLLYLVVMFEDYDGYPSTKLVSLDEKAILREFLGDLSDEQITDIANRAFDGFPLESAERSVRATINALIEVNNE